MPTPPQSSRFAVQVQTGPGIRHEIRGDTDPSKPIDAAGPECTIEGWFLPMEEGSVHGIRIMHGEVEVAAKRKQLRPDVLRHFPDHQDSLLSGFKAALKLKVGPNELRFEFKDAHKKWHPFASFQLRLPRLWKIGKLWQKDAGRNAYDRWWRQYERPSPEQLQQMREASSKMEGAPLFSILLRVVKGTHLKRTLDSLTAQVYSRWELSVVLGREKLTPAQTSSLSEMEKSGKRLTTHQLHSEAVAASTGAYVMVLDEGSAFAPHALYLLASEILKRPEVDLLYGDGDSVDQKGSHVSPRLATQWDIERVNYEPHPQDAITLRTSIALKSAIFRVEITSASSIWNLRLLATQLQQHDRLQISHLPHVLCHRPEPLAYPLTTLDIAACADSVVEGHSMADLEKVTWHESPRWRLSWPLPTTTLASIIIPTRNRVDLLRVALDSLFARTSTPNFEIIIVDHASDEAETLAYFKEVTTQHQNVRIVRADGPFNWSRLNNVGEKEARGDVLVFLNNDVEIIEGDWLVELVSNALRQYVGAVGGLLLYPNGTIQHAGIVLGMTGLAGHVFRTLKPDDDTLAGRPDVPREVTAVTGACLAVRRSVFQEARGFDEELAVSYNDVDFCLKLRAQGLRNIYMPFAKLIHHESVSRRDSEQESLRKAEASEEARIVLKRWPKEFQQDAFYSPNLSLEQEIPTLGNPPPRLAIES